MNIKPLGERVVIKKLEAKEKTESGILLPSQAKEKPQIAEVLAVGPGLLEDGKVVKMEVKIGDKVIFPNYSGTEVKIDGVELIIIEQSKLLAIVD
ncbi:co-chaperone GroES [Helicovermis profundi]|uniref:Co-chaperonin GroES n=1 Tax=Helicovermis profundi TaxID=3065157 RepID=A0AAU9E9N1_9FIRM|nr:co-chaperone GroES [Clostridia bacterium S502]